MFDFVKPRSLAFASLRPHEAVRITVDERPMDANEGFRVISLSTQAKNAIAIDESAPDHVVIRNKTAFEVPYIFVVLPLTYIRLIEADWNSLRLFLRSLQQYAPAWQVASATAGTVKPS